MNNYAKIFSMAAALLAVTVLIYLEYTNKQVNENSNVIREIKETKNGRVFVSRTVSLPDGTEVTTVYRVEDDGSETPVGATSQKDGVRGNISVK